jgi:class 3 adenylate cyclase/tetratricopeptide (TPR) repeat protein
VEAALELDHKQTSAPAVPADGHGLGDRKAFLERLITYVPFDAVLAAVAGGHLGPGRRDSHGTVVFADLSGFTALSESFAARGRDGGDELSHLLNRTFSSLLEEAIFPFEGFLVKFAGDSLLVYFEGPGDLSRACAAALAAQELMEKPPRPETGLRRLAMRIGVASGDFSLMTVGTPSGRLDTFLAGDASERAILAADRAGPRDIWVDAPGKANGVFRAGSDLLARISPDPPPERKPIAYVVGDLTPQQVEHAIDELKGFIAPILYERIVCSLSSDAVPSERRHGCAVFAELDDWSAGLETLCERYSLACELAARHGGLLNKIDGTRRGPRVLATFGIPLARGDDERRAVAFALELRDRLAGADVRVGIEAGPIFSGELGSALKRELTVLGDSVNVAARLANAAGPGEVLCGPSCWQRVDAFVGRPKDPLPLKGKSIPITPVAVTAPRRFTASPLVRRIGRQPLLGRERELKLLDEAARRALDGRLSSLTVAGPAGIGKSALVGIAVDRWIDSGGAAFGIRCDYERRRQPFAPLRALAAAWLGIPAEPTPALPAVRAAFSRQSIHDERLARLTSRVLDPNSADRGAARLFAARMVEQMTRRAPLMVVLDDAHNADDASVELFRSIATLLDRASLFLVAATRSRPSSDGSRLLREGTLELRPLGSAASRELLARALEAREVSELLADAVETRARGNPLFAQRLARWLSSRGLVAREGGKASMSLAAATDPASSLPPNLEALVLAEIDQLPQRVREVLRALSAVGQEIGASLAFKLCDCAGIGREEATEALEELSRSGLLIAAGGEPTSWLFSRISDREVIYSSLPVERRRALHAQVAAALGAQGSAGLAELALHYDAAEDHPQAARTGLAAARFAQRRGASSDALYLYRTTTRHLQALGEDATECRVAEVECLCALGLYSEARGLALELSERTPDPSSRVRALVAAARCASCEGESALASELTGRARAAIPQNAPPALQVSLLMACASHRLSLGQLQEALDELSAARGLASEETAPLVEGMASAVLAELGLADEALRGAEKACALAESQRHLGQQALALGCLGRALCAAGRLPEARDRYQQAEEIYDRLHQPMDAADAALHVAQIDLASGLAVQAAEELERVLETSRHFSAGPVEAAALCGIGRASWLQGDQERAARMLEQAVALSQTTLEPFAAICGRAFLAEALWRGEPQRARALLAESLEQTARHGFSIEGAQARQVAARLEATR